MSDHAEETRKAVQAREQAELDLLRRCRDQLLAAQDESGALSAGGNSAPLFESCLAGHALDRLHEREAAHRFHSWVLRCLRNGAGPAAGTWYTRSGRPAAKGAGGPFRAGEAGSPLAAWSAWLWSFSHHLVLHRHRAFPRSAVPLAVRIGKELLARWTDPEPDWLGSGPPDLYTANLAAFYGGLSQLDRWVRVPDAARRIGDIWEWTARRLSVDGRLGYRRSDPSPVDASLLWTTLPFDLLGTHDPLVKQTASSAASSGEIESWAPWGTACLVWLHAESGRLPEAEDWGGRLMRRAAASGDPFPYLLDSALAVLAVLSLRRERLIQAGAPASSGSTGPGSTGYGG